MKNLVLAILFQYILCLSNSSISFNFTKTKTEQCKRILADTLIYSNWVGGGAGIISTHSDVIQDGYWVFQIDLNIDNIHSNRLSGIKTYTKNILGQTQTNSWFGNNINNPVCTVAVPPGKYITQLDAYNAGEICDNAKFYFSDSTNTFCGKINSGVGTVTAPVNAQLAGINSHTGSWQSNTYLLNFQLVFKCNAGYIVDLSGLNCILCWSIANCQSIANGCICGTCNSGYHWLSGSCTLCSVVNCTQYSVECTCIKCSPGSKISVDQCVACTEPKCIHYSTGCTCDICTPGYQPNSIGNCEVCNVNNCEGYSSNCTCVSCKAGFYAYNGECQNCNINKCLHYSTNCTCDSCENLQNVSSGVCAPCENISNCTQYLSNCRCNHCNDSYKVDNGVCTHCNVSQCFVQINGCDCSECNDQYYVDNYKGCSNCTNPCEKCNILDTNCTSCISGYYYVQPNKCEKCDNSCKTCEFIATNCTECENNYYRYIANNTCLSKCPNGYFLNSSKVCEECNLQCMTCENASNNCLNCNENQSQLHPFSCVNPCPNGTYNTEENNCNSCNTSICKNCVDEPSHCVDCVDGLFQINNTCGCNEGQILSSIFHCDEILKNWSINYSIFPSYYVLNFPKNFTQILKSLENFTNFTTIFDIIITGINSSEYNYTISEKDDNATNNSDEVYSLMIKLNFTENTMITTTNLLIVQLHPSSQALNLQPKSINISMQDQIECPKEQSFNKSNFNFQVYQYILASISCVKEDDSAAALQSMICSALTTTLQPITIGLMSSTTMNLNWATLAIIHELSRFLMINFPKNLLTFYKTEKFSNRYLMYIWFQDSNNANINVENNTSILPTQYHLPTSYIWNNLTQIICELILAAFFGFAFKLIFYLISPEKTEAKLNSIQRQNLLKKQIPNKVCFSQLKKISIFFLSQFNAKFITHLPLILFLLIIDLKYLIFSSIGGIINFLLCIIGLWLFVRAIQLLIILNEFYVENTSIVTSPMHAKILCWILILPIKESFENWKEIYKILSSEYNQYHWAGKYQNLSSTIRFCCYAILIFCFSTKPIIPLCWILGSSVYFFLIISILPVHLNTFSKLQEIILEILIFAIGSELFILQIWDMKGIIDISMRDWIGNTIIFSNFLLFLFEIAIMSVVIFGKIKSYCSKKKNNQQKKIIRGKGISAKKQKKSKKKGKTKKGKAKKWFRNSANIFGITNNPLAMS